MRRVKGVLFADYVRMIRAMKSVDWVAQLGPRELAFVKAPVDHGGWYPMEIFEQLGNAILVAIAQGKLELVHMWGRTSADQLRAQQPQLVAPGDPVATLERFRTLRASYFDFDTLSVPLLQPNEAQVLIAYGMGMPAEEAASYQTLGFFERLLEIAGARYVSSRLSSRSWAGEGRTLLTLHWSPPAEPTR